MALHTVSHLLILLLVAGAACLPVLSFVMARARGSRLAFVSIRSRQHDSLLQQSTSTHDSESNVSNDGYSVVAVVAPLKYLGSYPCLTLRFPNLSSLTHSSDGVTLDFLLDTGANVNAIGTECVKDLKLPLVMSSKDLDILGSAGIGGALQPGDTFALGDCELVGLPPEQTTTFMRNLTAAGLGISTPVGDGVLGLNFFWSFPAGVEFDWYGTDGDPPTLVFYYGNELPSLESTRQGLVRVPLKQLAVGLLSLTITINGIDIPALLDTGSPITVLNQEAAQLLSIEMVPLSTVSDVDIPRKQTYGDENLLVGGADGVPVNLQRSASSVSIRAGDVSLGEGPVYVGDLPGLQMIGGMTGSSLPAVVLGLDSLRRTYRMILRAPESEVWFEELHDQKRGIF